MYCGLAFPAIIAVIAILDFWGRSEWHIVIVLGIFGIPLLFRLVRSVTLATATKEYITAAKSQGATSFRVLFHDIFPNVAPSLIAYSVFTLGGVITIEGALAFLGLSVQPPQSSWGKPDLGRGWRRRGAARLHLRPRVRAVPHARVALLRGRANPRPLRPRRGEAVSVTEGAATNGRSRTAPHRGTTPSSRRPATSTSSWRSGPAHDVPHPTWAARRRRRRLAHPRPRRDARGRRRVRLGQDGPFAVDHGAAPGPNTFLDRLGALRRHGAGRAPASGRSGRSGVHGSPWSSRTR